MCYDQFYTVLFPETPEENMGNYQMLNNRVLSQKKVNFFSEN